MKKFLLAFFLACFALPVCAEQAVRVLLADGLKSAQIQNSGLVYVYAKNSKKKYKVSKPETITVQALGDGELRIGALKYQGTLVIEPSKNVTLTFQKNTYTGKLYAVPNGKTFKIIEYADMENYLLGVLPYEMSPSWPLEALKAQAVAARTYTLMEVQRRKNAEFDLYNDVRSQMYKGSGKVYNSVRQAVTATEGQILTYKGKPFYTYYHANCGGGTDDAKSWTGSKEATIKPLQGASCSADSHSKSYSWTRKVPQKSINNFVNRNGLKGSVKKIKVAKKSRTKRAETLEFTTSSGKKELSCPKFRLSVGSSVLRSCKITDIEKTSGGFTFSGRGYGHGVGLCQDGAKGMAEDGKNYKKILANYFPSSDITKQ